MKVISDIDTFSINLRKRLVDLKNEKIFISSLSKSEQENDLRKQPNCQGYGRIRHFKLTHDSNWINDPLPISPANHHLNTNFTSEIEAQVFQLGGCNYRCWYCFVDNNLISAKSKFGKFYTANDLINLYLQQNSPPKVIDLSGGQPDLVPEWTIWMMEALIENELQDKVLLWSDDNLSNDFFWRFLSKNQLDFLKSYKNYARVCCFKGIDEESFSINTRISKERFNYQFDLFKKIHELDIDLYGYITLTAPLSTNFEFIIPKLFDRFQEIHENLPLRIVPLKIEPYTPLKSRIRAEHEELLAGQLIAMNYWNIELNKRFSTLKLNTDISKVNIKAHPQ